jgi:protein-L-isoaspartate O-methyltransferase
MSIGFYEDNAEWFFQRTVNVDMSATQARFLSFLEPGAAVLDAGCGSGRDAKVFRDLGFNVTAMEAAPSLAALAQAHIGLPVEVMTFDQITWRDRFDGIWACASLLHVPATDLPGIMGRLRDAMTPGGILWASFKFGTGERVETERSFTDFDETRMTALLAHVGGLGLIEMWITPDSRNDFAHQSWLNVLCRKSA